MEEHNPDSLRLLELLIQAVVAVVVMVLVPLLVPQVAQELFMSNTQSHSLM